MNKLQLCFAYPWATFGGVERMLLNRALAFRQAGLAVTMDVFFLHDAGGLAGLEQAIERHGLQDWLRVSPSLTHRPYDCVLVIDSPELIARCREAGVHYVVECHTHYDENRRYLQGLDLQIPVIVPSEYFLALLQKELSDKNPQRLQMLRNFVPWDVEAPPAELRLPDWGRRPLLFLGRMDRLKDPLALLDAFQLMTPEQQSRFVLLFCGPLSGEVDMMAEINRRDLESSVVVLPPVPFFGVSGLLHGVARAGGIMVSPSRAESFGLSAAEAISAGVPVALSNIPAHVQLLGNSGHAELHCYEQGNAQALAQCILAQDANYEAAAERMQQARHHFSAQVFIDDWQHLATQLQLGEQS